MILTQGLTGHFDLDEADGFNGPGGGDGFPTPNAPPPPAAEEKTEGDGTTDEPQVTPMPPAPAAVAAAPLPYQPNLKFKVHGKDLEVDEWLRPLITDATSEQKVRELLEKAHGLDHVKAGRQTAMAQLETVTSQHQGLVSSVQNLTGMVNRGDLESFFEALQIPEKAVLEYAMRRVQYAQADPAARQAYDQWRATQAQATQLAAENQGYRSQMQSQSVQARTQELDIAVARPEVMAVSEAFDARVGTPGAFRAEVINRGKFWAYQQKDISVDQAIKEVMAMVGANPGAAASAPGQQAAGAGQLPPAAGAPQAAPKAPDRKPVIPNIAGNGTSPAKIVPKSIKQLREMGQQMAAGR